MIQEQQDTDLTIVLGAGASYEVGMPVGSVLKDQISKVLSFKFESFGRLKEGSNLSVGEALYVFGQDKEIAGDTDEHFRTAALITSNMPLAFSIDNFIDSHRDNPLVARVGKVAIAYSILAAERASKIYYKRSNAHNTLPFSSVTNTWYIAFFQLLSQNTQANELADKLKRIKIITFNYDRTLEHFLINAIKSFYNISEQTAFEIFSSLKIFHPYGQVGELHWSIGTGGNLFGGEPTSHELIKVSQDLLTFTQGTSIAESHISEIRSAIRHAKKILFLGFAYHSLNLDLLYEPGTVISRSRAHVFGTAYGFSESNKEATILDLCQRGGYNTERVVLRRELTAAQMMDEYSRSLPI